MAVSNDVILNQNISATGSVSTTAPVTTASANVDVTAQTSNDTIATGNSQDTQAKTKRSVEQLYQAIQALCSSNGIDFNEVKKMGLLSSISGKNEEALLNAEQEEITKIVKLIEETIAAMKEDGIELTAENLEKQARGYQIQLACGWDSIASFRKRNKVSHESVIERLDRVAKAKGKTPFSQLTSVEDKAKALKEYFKDFFDAKVQAGASEEEIKKLQLTDFSKLLFNTSDAEKNVLRDAIQYLAGDSRFTALKSVFDSCDTQAARTQLANSTTHEMMQAMSLEDENFHIAPSSEDMTAMTALVVGEKDAEHVTEYHTDAQKTREEFFTEENIAKLEAIKTKVENGENLTEEEQALLQEAKFHTSDAAGEIVGVGNNKVVSEDFKNNMLETLNTDAYANPNYREVLDQVNKYIEEHPECLTMPKEEFIEKMNEVTNGNFDKVVTGSSEPLKAPEAKQETPSTPSNNQPPLTAADIEEYRANIAARNAQIAAQSSEPDVVETEPETVEKQWTRAEIAKNPLAFFKSGLKNISDNEIRFAFNNLSNTIQTMALEVTGGKFFNLFMDEASDSAILATNKGRTLCQTKALEEARQEIEEQMA